jgi:hypothetical protein
LYQAAPRGRLRLRGFRRSDITASTALIVFVAIAVLHVDGTLYMVPVSLSGLRTNNN